MSSSSDRYIYWPALIIKRRIQMEASAMLGEYIQIIHQALFTVQGQRVFCRRHGQFPDTDTQGMIHVATAPAVGVRDRDATARYCSGLLDIPSDMFRFVYQASYFLLL
jgi:hypothetical protein